VRLKADVQEPPNMPTVRALVLRAPGTNCHEETAFAFKRAGAEADIVRLDALLAESSILESRQILCVPGGFSFGDDLGAGRVFAAKLGRRFGDALHAHRARGGLILGVCNGFQVLLQTGLLVKKTADGRARASLAQNAHGRFEDRWIHLELTPSHCVFIGERATITLPVAHGEGNFVVENDAVLAELETAGQIVCRYVSPTGERAGFPHNPNGSTAGVAGVCDDSGRVFALMPHPERHLTPYQHPTWTKRRAQPEHGDGFRFFANAVRYFR
jgi:phosphoribosylformylglycinamidine synthase